MRLGAQPLLWKWVLFAWEWKMISISKAENLPSFWNRGPEKLGNGLLAQFAPHCRHCYSWVSSPTNDTFCVLLPEASLPGLVRSVVHGKHVRPYAGKPSETEWIRTRVRCHHYNQYRLHRKHHHRPYHQYHHNHHHHHHHCFYHDKISERTQQDGKTFECKKPERAITCVFCRTLISSDEKLRCETTPKTVYDQTCSTLDQKRSRSV